VAALTRITELYCNIKPLEEPNCAIVETVSLRDGQLHHFILTLDTLLPGDPLTLDRGDNYWFSKNSILMSQLRECMMATSKPMLHSVGVSLATIFQIMETLHLIPPDARRDLDSVSSGNKSITEEIINNSQRGIEATAGMVVDYLEQSQSILEHAPHVVFKKALAKKLAEMDASLIPGSRLHGKPGPNLTYERAFQTEGESRSFERFKQMVYDRQ
jgi:hypothetical protein